MTMSMVYLLFLIAASTSEAAIGDDAVVESPIHCKDSDSVLFQNGDPNDILKIEIVSDQAKLNDPALAKRSPPTQSPAILSYLQDEKQVIVGGRLTGRGKSRWRCNPRPFKFEFESERTIESLVSKTPHSTPVEVYEQLDQLRKSEPLLKSESQKNNLFTKLGDDIKIVNPCYTAGGDGQWLGATSPEEQKKRLLKEYYVYKMLGELETTTLKVRLAEMTYQDPQGKITSSGYSFFREPETKAMKRCNLEKSADPGRDAKNLSAQLQVELQFAFIGGIDYRIPIHNIVAGHDSQGKAHYIGYDYDTSGLVSPYYLVYSGGTYEDLLKKALAEMEENMKNILGRYEPSLVKIHVQPFLAKQTNMLGIIQNSLLDQESKTDMIRIMNQQFSILQEFAITH